MTRVIHIALAVRNLEESIKDYSKRLGQDPVIIVKGKYALFRTKEVNLSISEKPGATEKLRHLGFEDSNTPEFKEEIDCNGILWESFNREAQEEEISRVYVNAVKVNPSERN